MGIQINGNTDIISATDGSLTIQGASGNITGNLTGTATTAQGLTGTPNITVGTIGATSLVVSGITTVAAGSTAAPSITPTGDSNTGIFFPSADTIAFGEGGAEALRIDSSGNIGIGTNNPTDKLSIHSAPNALVLGAKDTTRGNHIFQLLADDSSGNGELRLYKNPASGTHEKTVEIASTGNSYFTGGNVGIGTASPVARLHVQTSGTGTTAGSNIILSARSEASGRDAAIQFADGTTSAYVGMLSGAIYFADSGSTERARIDSSGRLLVGTSSYSGNSAFVIKGGAAQNVGLVDVRYGTTRPTGADVQVSEIRFGSTNFTSNSAYANIQCITDGASSSDADIPGRLVFSTTADGASTPTERLRLTSSGFFQSMPIYNTTGGDAPNVVVNSAGTTYRSTSSAKYKTDIETLQDQYADAVLGFRPVWYRSKCEIDNPEWSYWGFIAEEVAEIDPRLVSWKTTETSYDEQGAVVQTPLETPEPEGVQYDRFVPHLLNLIKRQKEQIEAMEARLSALESA